MHIAVYGTRYDSVAQNKKKLNRLSLFVFLLRSSQCEQNEKVERFSLFFKFNSLAYTVVFQSIPIFSALLWTI